MRRVEILILLLVLGLAIPGALLVSRALDSVRVEREVRHRAVSERIFDELERALSELLATEEQRPFESYGFWVDSASGPERSALSYPPTDTPVVGYFQIDPDGTLHSPLEPRPGEPVPADWSLAPGVRGQIAALRQTVLASWRQAARSTAGISPATAGLTAPADAEPLLLDDGARKEESTAYDVLQRLNIASEQRADRQKKIQYTRSATPTPSAPSRAAMSAETTDLRTGKQKGILLAEGFADADAAMKADDASGAPRSSLGQAAPESEETKLRLGEAERIEPPVPVERTPEAKIALAKDMAEALPSTLAIVLDPMTSRPGQGARLLLYRTVIAGEQGYRQGLVLDTTLLGDWLRDRVIGANDLADVAQLWFDDPDAAARTDGGYRYGHRFAEPFESLEAMLRLSPLPDAASATSIYALALLLAAVTIVGLLSLHHMVRVALHFAERRNNFVAAVSHELKTPLTAIRMYAEMLRDGLVANDEKRDEYYGTISDESERLSRLVDNVLEFSRLEKGQRELSQRVGDLAPVIREVVDTLRPHAARQGFRLLVEEEEALPPVRYDRDAMVQMLFNLVDNAIKYASGATRRDIVVHCRRTDGGLEVAIRDFGPGVPKKDLTRIFEPFYRGGDELTRSAKGTGIGLALVGELAEAMGAAVSATSPEDGGLCIQLAFAGAEGTSR